MSLPVRGGGFCSGVCSGPATEVTSEVRALELFLSGFACLSWLVTTLVFGSLESFSATAFMTVFISWISTLISFTSWATTSGFVVALVSHITALCFGCWDIFCHFHLFCSLYTPSCFWIGDILSMFLFGNLFFFLPYLTISRTSAIISLAVSTFVVILAIVMYAIFSASSPYWRLCTLVLVVPKPLTFVIS